MLVKELICVKSENFNVKLEFSEKEINNYYNYEEYHELISYKNKIDNRARDWDKSKKLSNDYELIHIPNKNSKCESIAEYDPLSRSYFKMWEILCFFDFLSKDEIKCGCLAEGPGGFIEAIVNYRKQFYDKTDSIYAITLRSTHKDIPGWKKAQDFLINNPNIKISYGKDNTGNLYNIDNIINFSDFISDKVDLVTGDAGFDFSDNFNNQERMSMQIIFCEIVTALTIQKKGGSFLCKLFDTYNHISIQFIQLLYNHYEKVYLIKPNTSRPANSEKYIFCRNFKGIDETLLKKLHILVKTWNYLESKKMFINSISNSKINSIMLEQILDFNTETFNLQVCNINKTLEIINSKKDLKTLSNIIENQTKRAIEWCLKHKIKINNKSNFLS